MDCRNLLVPLLLGCAAGSAGLAQTRWTPLGFEGGPVPALAYQASGGRLLAATLGSGVARSSDGARLWDLSGAGLQDPRVLALVVSPDGPIYAGTQSGGVSVSADGGQSWQAASAGLPTYQVSDGGTRYRPVRGLGAGPGRLWALVQDQIQVYSSIDGGASWQASGAGLDSPAAQTGRILADRDDPNRVYLALHTHDVAQDRHRWLYVSGDGGASWQPSEAGLAPDDRTARALLFSPGAPPALFLGVDAATGKPNLFRSLDRGATWQPASGGLPQDASIGELIEVDGVLIAGTGAEDCSGALGLYGSTDRGTSWQKLSSDLDGVPIVSLVSDGQDLYAATGAVGPGPAAPGCGRGVFRSRDGGARWEPASRKLGTAAVLAVSTDLQDPNTSLAATGDGGLHLTRDGGASWASARGDLPAGRATVVRILSGAPPELLVLLSFEPASGLYRSADLGLNWLDLSGSGAMRLPAPERYTGLAVLGPGHYLAGGEQGIFETVDGGASWQRRDQGIPETEPQKKHVLALAAGATGVQLAAGTAQTGVWRYDGAEPWQPSSTGLPTGGSGEGFSGVTALLWDVSAVPQPQGLYAGTADAGLYRRARDQDPWSEANAMLTSVSGAYGAVAALAQKRQGGGLLLGFGAEPGSGFLGGLWQSDDRGATWSPAGAGLPRAALTALALGGPDGSSVLAGTDGAGLAVSADGGAGFQAAGPFTALAPGLGAIAVDPQDPNRVWVASRQGGVYRSLDGGLRFEPFNAGLSSADVLALAFATSAGPSAPAVLYAGTADGLFRSPDGASPWEAAGSGLPPGPVAAVLVSGGGPGPAAGTVWAAVQGAGLHVQPNGAPGFGPAGLTQPVATLLRERSSGLVWAGTDGAGVYESLDGLGTWFEVNSGLPATALSIGDLELAAPADGRGTRQPQDVIWLGARGGGGVRRYRPGVRGTLVWEDTGLAAGLDVRALQYVADTDSLYAGTDQGVWRLRPAATAVGAWSLVDGIPPDPAAQSIQDLALVPPGPGALAGLLASTDAGLFRIEISFTRSAVAGLLPGLTVLAGALAALIQGAARLARSRSRKRR